MKISAVSSEICEVKNDAQKLFSPVVKAHAKHGEVAGRQGEVLKGFPLQLPVHGWLAGLFQLENLKFMKIDTKIIKKSFFLPWLSCNVWTFAILCS